MGSEGVVPTGKHRLRVEFEPTSAGSRCLRLVVARRAGAFRLVAAE